MPHLAPLAWLICPTLALLTLYALSILFYFLPPRIPR